MNASTGFPDPTDLPDHIPSVRSVGRKQEFRGRPPSVSP